MIKTFSAYTTEVDDVDLAVSELVEGLDYEGKLLDSTVGILSCFAEFTDTGVVAALREKLPFEFLGATTIANTTKGEPGETMLCLLVITSDEMEFVTGVTGPIEDEDAGELRAAYEEAARGHKGKPAFMFSFAPLLFNLSVDFFVGCMDDITGGVPNFGTLPVDHNTDYHESCVILNGKAWRDRYAFVLAYGDVVPKFFIGTISDEKVFPEKGAVTASQGNQLQSVNGKPMTEYLVSLGLTQNEDGSITGINSFPVIVNYNDGTEPVVRAMFALTPEGYAVCGGKVPVGSTLAMGRFDPEEIVSTSTATLEKALAGGEFQAMLIYSCVGRYFTLQYDQMAEIQMVVDKMQKKGVTHMMAYSGGEICPVYDREGKPANRGHNNTFVICAL